MRSTLFLVLLAAGAAATGFFAYRHLVAPDPVARAPAPEAARNAPDFALPDLEGRMRMSDEWDGRVRVVNFWATWCPPCRKEIPLLKEIQSEYADRGVQIIGIAMDETEAVTEYAQTMEFNYPVLIGQQEAVDLGNLFLKDFIGLPFTVFTDRDGRIVDIHTGELHRDQIESYLGRIL
jgi:thiol-disulfide isomerase/thioredoxin